MRRHTVSIEPVSPAYCCFESPGTSCFTLLAGTAFLAVSLATSAYLVTDYVYGGLAGPVAALTATARTTARNENDQREQPLHGVRMPDLEASLG